MKIFDISISLEKNMPVWPGNKAPQITQARSIRRGDASNDTKIEMNMHSGTHIDAPLHFLAQGKTITDLSLQGFIGKALVVHLPKAQVIDSEVLRNIRIPRGVTRILFKTSNSLLWRKKETSFNKKYVGLTVDGALWLVKKEITLIGVDYLSVATFREIAEVHKTFLKKGVVLLEGIDLSAVTSGIYTLVSMPLKISAVEAAPVRAILIKQ